MKVINEITAISELPIPDAIQNKAVEFYKGRIDAGESAFARKNEEGKYSHIVDPKYNQTKTNTEIAVISNKDVVKIITDQPNPYPLLSTKAAEYQERQFQYAESKKAFIEYGVKGTSMVKISELAQVSKRTVYNHFANKEVLVMYIMSDLWHQATVQLDIHYQHNLPLAEQLETLILTEARLLSSQDYLDLSRVAFGHFFYRPDQLKEEMLKYSAQETALCRWLKEAIEDGKLTIDDIEFANCQLHNLVKGSCFWPQLLQIQPILAEGQLKKIAFETTALFLSHNEVK
jgi:TetR/AcrR family transcriptional regulator of autoinduction and epiphytic fitness